MVVRFGDEEDPVSGPAGEDRSGVRREGRDPGGGGETFQGVGGHGEEAFEPEDKDWGPSAAASVFGAQGEVNAGPWCEAEATHRPGAGPHVGGDEEPPGTGLHGRGHPLGGEPAWGGI